MNEEEKMKNLEIYGEVDYLKDGEKISLISNKFKSATIKGSAFSNELKVLNDEYGMYQNIKNVWQLCEIKKTEGIGYGDYYDVKHIEELTLDKLFEIVNDEELQRYLDEKVNESLHKKRFYYEIDINQKKSYRDETRYVHFYVEVNNNCYEINIDSNGYVEIMSGYFEIYDDYGNLQDKFKQMVNDEIVKYVDKGILKLENGFVYKNNYYETFEEVKEEIDKELEILKGSDE